MVRYVSNDAKPTTGLCLPKYGQFFLARVVNKMGNPRKG